MENRADPMRAGDEVFKEEVERVGKLPNPLLVIGLGGTGQQGVKRMKDLFHERFVLPKDDQGRYKDAPERTAYLVIDSDRDSGVGFEGGEFIDITVPGMKQVLDPTRRDNNLQPYEREWVHDELNAVSEGMGAGTIRQSSRLMLFRNSSLIHSTIKSKLLSLTVERHGELQGLAANRIEVVIIAGISGGTGSGTFLDIAQFIRHINTEPEFVGRVIHITGYIVMPDVSIQVATNETLKDIWMSNAFAALKELDFWMRIKEHGARFTQDYSPTLSVTWQFPPFDQCALLCATTMGGRQYENAMDVVVDTMAENLLHYLASETVPDGRRVYSFIQHEDNIGAAIENMVKPLPLCYRYRAIGAYYKRLPRHRAQQYEGKLLLGTVVPPKDQHGAYVLVLEQLKDGNMQQRAAGVAGDLNALYLNYVPNVPLPEFCGWDPSNKQRMNQLRAMNPRPHSQDVAGERWEERVAQPKSADFAGRYFEAAWGRFKRYAQDVLEGRDQRAKVGQGSDQGRRPQLSGPFHLRRYLTEPGSGLITYLEGVLNKWDTFLTEQQAARGRKKDYVDKELWPKFIKPPMIQFKQTVEDTYQKELNIYFDLVRRVSFVEAYAKALRKLIGYIVDYVNESLDPLIAALVEMSDSVIDVDEAVSVNDIIPFTKLKEILDETFAHKNKSGEITDRLLAQMKEEALEYGEDVTRNSGVRWRMTGQRVRSLVGSALRDNFTDINVDSADTSMERIYGDDAAAQNDYMDTLADSLVVNAVPLFMQHPTHQTDFASVDYSFLSMPANAPRHIERFTEHLTNTAQFRRTMSPPKISSITDHIYCLNSNDGLPLYHYGLMEDLERTYERMNPRRKGLHLVQNEPSNGLYSRDWVHLPSPRPYYLFGQRPGKFAEKEYTENRQVIETAMACGLIEVAEPGRAATSFTLRTLYTDALRQTVVSDNMIIKEVAAIAAGEGSVDEKMAKYNAYYDRAHVDTMQCEGDMEHFVPMLGLIGQPVRPWDQQTMADPDLLERAKENRRKLAREQVICQLSLAPHILSRLRIQVKGFVAVAAAIASTTGEKDKWVGYHAKVRDAQMMLIYRQVFPLFTNLMYTQFDKTPQVLIDKTALPENEKDWPNASLLAKKLSDLEAEKGPVYELLYDQLRDASNHETQMRLTRKELESLQANAELLIADLNASANTMRFTPPSGIAVDDLTNIRRMLADAQAITSQFISDTKMMIAMKPAEA